MALGSNVTQSGDQHASGGFLAARLLVGRFSGSPAGGDPKALQKQDVKPEVRVLSRAPVGSSRHFSRRFATSLLRW